MGLSGREVLETTLFDSGQIVTVNYLSRRARISVDEATEVLRSFYEETKGTAKLFAVYVVSGELRPSNDGSSGGDGQGGEDVRMDDGHQDGVSRQQTRRRRLQLVREARLDTVKDKYQSVDTCELFALHTAPIKSIYTLYSVDQMGEEEFLESDPSRSWISCPAADVKRMEMLEEHAESTKDLEQAATLHKSESSSAEAHTSKSIAQRSAEKNDISALLAKAAARPKVASPKKTPRKGGSVTPTGTPTKVAKKESGTTSPADNQKKRGQRILIDDENDWTPNGSGEAKSEAKDVEVTASKVDDKIDDTTPMEVDGETTAVAPKPRRKAGVKVNDKKGSGAKAVKGKGKKERDTPAAKKKDKPTLLSDDDLFADEVSSPERAVEDDLEGDWVQREKTPPKRKPTARETVEKNERENEEVCAKKATRKEYVAESFVDEDGFMVTKQVLKEVPIETTTPSGGDLTKKTSASMPTDAPKVSSAVASKSKAAAKKVPQGQAKISSFFKKA